MNVTSTRDQCSAVAIRADNLSKRYRLRRERQRSIAEGVTRLLRWEKNTLSELWALKQLSFEVERGSALGIVGRNGSGKSTLLKVLAGTVVPSGGTLEVAGRVSALIELGAGFHPSFTARDNIYVAGALLGIGEREMRQRFDEIVAFSGIGEFVDTPLKYFSSGMLARLGFAVSLAVDADIIIVDEVLAVGDAAFQQKCLSVMSQHKRSGKTILFVSHATGHVVELCDRAIWLDKGEIQAIGTPAEVCDGYLRETTGISHSAESGVVGMFAPLGAGVA